MTRRFFCKVLLVAVAVFGLLALSGVLLAQGRSEEALEHARAVQERHTNALMAKPGVVGTAVGLGQSTQPVVLVLLEHGGVPGIPEQLEGVPVRPLVTGKIYALRPPGGSPPGQDKKPPKGEEPVDPTARFDRPVPIGVSTGNAGECSAGTIGCRVSKGSAVYALSNNHVYALENDAEAGSEVLQPGRYDTNCNYDENNVIGTLADFVEIDFDGGNNTVDAAIALSSKSLLGNATPSDGYGKPTSTTVDATLYEQVQKYGRTTSLTKGTITGINVIVDVGYSSGTAHFVNQIIVEARSPFIKAGDSGSLLVTQDGNNPVGLLFAGNVNGKLAVANPIDEVLDAFGVTVDVK